MNKRPQILIIDDEPTARDTLAALLYQEDYELAVATSGLEALSRLQELDPDVILLDVMMPGMDGFEVCRHLKADKCRRHIPIILITALNSKEDVVNGLDAGADEFLAKPVNGLELRARVRSMLRIKKQHDDLVAALQLREDLADMIVHDMRIPLTTIQGFSQLLLNRSTISAEYMVEIERIYTQAQRLHRFTDDLLMLAKMEQGRLILNRSPVDINQLALQLEKTHRIMAQSKGLNFILDLAPGQLRPVSLDANLCERVLDNLLSNAFKFSSTGGTVRLRLEPITHNGGQTSSPSVRIKIMDEGPGIPAEHRQRIFDKFEVLTLKQRALAQIGLGLAFCKLVVETHGGRLWVEPNEPQGSIFIIEV